MHEALGDDGDALARAELAHADATVLYYDGDYEACIAAEDRALTGYERVRDWERFRKALSEKSSLLGIVGRRREARLLLRGRLAVATEENDLREMGSALGSLALWDREVVSAVALLVESAAVLRRGGYGESEINALANGLEAAVEAGAWDTADAIVEDLSARSGLRPRWSIHSRSASRSSPPTGAKRRERSTSWMASARRRWHRRSGAVWRAWYRRARSTLLLMAGDVDEGYAEAMASMGEDPGGLNANFGVWIAGRAALWLGDAAKLEAVLAAPADVEDTGWAAAMRRSFEAGLTALRGHSKDAAGAYAAVLADRSANGDRFAHAQMVVDATAVLPLDLLPAETVGGARLPRGPGRRSPPGSPRRERQARPAGRMTSAVTRAPRRAPWMARRSPPRHPCSSARRPTCSRRARARGPAARPPPRPSRRSPARTAGSRS